VDNDGDGWIDLDDPGCIGDSAHDTEGGFGSGPCSDGIDNDADGQPDSLDPQCLTAFSASE
jgi:hypothetical protein